jgi:drug/metabolite transporter (DMT)-like permease
LSGGVVGLAMMPFAPPLPASAWPYLAGSIAVHQVYYFCLLQAYRHGDLNHVYPIARGLGPFLVALASGPVVGEILSLGQMAGTALVSIGIGSLALAQGGAAKRHWHPNLYAIATGLTIAAYTFLDGLGGRASAGNVLGYVAWLNVLEAPWVPLLAIYLRGRQMMPYLRAQWWRGAAGGVIAAVGYGIAIWAFTQGSFAHVAALRETSVIFAALIGTLLLRESFGAFRIFAAILVVAGIMLMNLT